MWQTLQKMRSIQSVAEGNSTLYFTPADVNLSIETLTGPGSTHQQQKGTRQQHPKKQ